MTVDAAHARPRLGNALHPAIQAIVTDALALGVGATLPTNAHYLEKFGIGAGTMQRALAVLQDREALRVTARGHLGRVLATLDVGQAWQAAGLSPIRLLLPPSGPAEIDVLDNRLAHDLTAMGIPHTVHHLRGGKRRLDAIDSGSHDVALVSAGVAGERPAATEDATRLRRRLGPGSYYAPGRLVVVRRTADTSSAPDSVAIDRQSPDHVALTLDEFPESGGYRYVETPFPGVPAAVLRGTVAAGIWHMTKTIIPLDLAGLVTTPIGLGTRAIWESLSAAVLVGWSGRPELASVLNSLPLSGLEKEQVAAIAIGDTNALEE